MGWFLHFPVKMRFRFSGECRLRSGWISQKIEIENSQFQKIISDRDKSVIRSPSPPRKVDQLILHWQELDQNVMQLSSCHRKSPLAWHKSVRECKCVSGLTWLSRAAAVCLLLRRDWQLGDATAGLVWLHSLHSPPPQRLSCNWGPDWAGAALARTWRHLLTLNIYHQDFCQNETQLSTAAGTCHNTLRLSLSVQLRVWSRLYIQLKK